MATISYAVQQHNPLTHSGYIGGLSRPGGGGYLIRNPVQEDILDSEVLHIPKLEVRINEFECYVLKGDVAQGVAWIPTEAAEGEKLTADVAEGNIVHGP